jgi:hypothetical protein
LHFEICALFTGVGIYNYFKAMFKQSLLNFWPFALKLMLNQAIYVRLLILFCTFSTVQQTKFFRINVEVCRPIIATSIQSSIHTVKF